MARLRLPSRLRRDRGELAEGAAPPPPRRAAPSVGVLRRERRTLVHAREERLRDLGGLMLEMFRRDHFREDLIREQCSELVAIEARLQELDVLLGRASAPVRCACGAPLLAAAHFCPNCGRPAGAVIAACARCGHPLPADASFCPSCGERADAEAEAAEVEAGEPAEPPPAEATVVQAAEPALDPWES